MNFFSAQQSARRSTLLLGLLFLLAIIILLLISNIFLFEYLYFSRYSTLTLFPGELKKVYDPNLAIILTASIFAFIVIGSFYKLMTLLSGGAAIAQSVGGVVIPRSSNNPQHKKILNIVQEMALASGMPVPQVYLLNEQGINAFAAGWKISNAVIGITQGALDKLNRDELQGVIAHEFSHIFNGDMKINIRLIAILHSILLIGLIGRFALRTLRFGSGSSRSSKKGNSGNIMLIILAVGIVMTIIGYTGTFFGNWIKSLISKQREYLADASAVQFTRNNTGIANALKKIGGATYGSQILSASADEYSHGYFALSDTHSRFFSFATHPPLKERIKRLQPSWNGQYIHLKTPKKDTQNTTRTNPNQHYKIALANGLALNTVLNSLNSIGDLNETKLDLAQQWQQNIPDFVRLYSENSSDARLLVFALLLDKKEPVATQQLTIIDTYQAKGAKEVKWLATNLQSLKAGNSINIIDMALPSLQLMSLSQFKAFQQVIRQLIKADKKTDLNEWPIQRLLLQHLNTHFGLRKPALQHYFVLGSARQAIETLLSLLSYLEHRNNPEEAKLSFDIAKKSINAHAFNPIDIKHISLKTLDQAIDQLEQLKPPLKKKFLTAAVHCIAHDHAVKPQSYELLRAIASCIDTPLPPVYSKLA